MASTYQMPVDVVCEDGFVPEYKHEGDAGPTCRIGYVPCSADRSCSACGVTFSTGTYQGGDHEEHEFVFCPNCGAKVVR